MRTRLLALLAVVLLAAGGLGTAHAASLAVAPSTLTSVAVQGCVPAGQTVTVTRTEPVYFLFIFLIGYEGVRVSGLPDACRSLPVQAAGGTGGTPLVQGTVPATGSTTLEWDVARYGTGTTFRLVVDGWSVATTTTNA